MMKKTSAGGVWFRSILFLLGAGLAGWGTGAFAQDIPVVADAPAAVVESVQRPPPSERLEALKSADLKTLKAAQADCLKAAQEYTEKIPELRRLAFEAHEDARLNSPEAQALRQQITELEAKLAQTLKEMPQVKEKFDAIRQAEQDMLAELQLRTALGPLVARQGGGDEDVEPVSEDEPAE